MHARLEKHAQELSMVLISGDWDAPHTLSSQYSLQVASVETRQPKTSGNQEL